MNFCCVVSQFLFFFSLLLLLMWGTRLLDTEPLLATQTQTLNASQNMVSILKCCWLCWFTPTHFCFSAGRQSWHFTNKLDSLLLLPNKFGFALVFFLHRPPGIWWKLINDTSKIILKSKKVSFTTWCTRWRRYKKNSDNKRLPSHKGSLVETHQKNSHMSHLVADLLYF